MLATRIIAVLLISDGQLVKGKQFVNDRKIGSIQQTVNIMQKREIDEMIILDVDATREGRLIDYHLVKELTTDCFMPLGFGGGVKSVDDVGLLLENGADKVVIGEAREDLNLIELASKKFGSQSICVVYNYWDLISNGILKWYEKYGAGEVILNCILRDGMMSGYDLETLSQVKLNIPVIACGGAGSYEHLYQGIRAGADAVAGGSIWAFTECTPIGVKKYLKEKGINIRL
jgi:imidazole glycerol-phosphate synthase subunit HisF